MGTDINKRECVPSINFLNSFHEVPYSTDSKYYQCIIDICKKENIDYLLPSLDIDQKLFYPENPDLKNLNIKSLSTPKTSLDFYSNKIKIFEFLKQNQFIAPVTYKSGELALNKEYFVKPVYGYGSANAKVLTGQAIRNLNNIDDYIIQEICSFPEITLECFYKNGELATVARERLDVKSGVCTKAKIYANRDLHVIAYKFAQSAVLPMFFNLQFMKNSKNEFVITDVNLRLAAGTSMSAKAGWDVVSAVLDAIAGKTHSQIFANFNLNFKTQYVTRVYEDIITGKLE